MEFEHDTEQHRYLVRVDGQVASAIDYADDGRVVAMTHTVTNPPFRGRGLAGELVAYAVDDVASAGKRVRAACWYVEQWFESHPEHAELLAG